MRYKTNHQVSGFTFYTVSDYFTPKIVSYRGEDAVKVFLTKIQKEKRRILNVMDNIEDMHLTPAEEKRFKSSRSCHICKGSFNGEEDLKGYKVRDHCHFTGKHIHT